MECPNAVVSLDGYFAMKKPNKAHSHVFFKYKGYFFLVLLALVDAEYKFLLVNVGASGSSSDAQIFNHSKLRQKIENETLRLPPPEPLGPGGPNLHYFLLGDNTFCPYALAGQALQQKTTDQRRENCQLQDIQGQEGGRECFGILVGRFRVLLITIEQRPKVVRDIVLTCVVQHNML